MKNMFYIIGSAPEYVVSDKRKNVAQTTWRIYYNYHQNYQLDPNRYVEIRNELTQKLENIQFEKYRRHSNTRNNKRKNLTISNLRELSTFSFS